VQNSTQEITEAASNVEDVRSCEQAVQQWIHVAEWGAVAQDELLVEDNDVPLLSTVSADHIMHAVATYPEHHALSVRWWTHLQRVEDLDRIRSELPPPRHFLWSVALELDVMSSELFRAQSLGLSRPLTHDEAEKLARLVESKAALPLPSLCPRRLGLAWALELTAKDDEVDRAHELWGALVAANNPDDRRTVLVYREFVLPLVQQIERDFGFTVESPTMHVQRVEYVRSAKGRIPVIKVRGDPFAVTPRINHIGAMQEALWPHLPSGDGVIVLGI
jgi:hypothetical protein